MTAVVSSQFLMVFISFSCVLVSVVKRWFSPCLLMSLFMLFYVLQLLWIFFYVVTWTEHCGCLVITHPSLSQPNVHIICSLFGIKLFCVTMWMLRTVGVAVCVYTIIRNTIPAVVSVSLCSFPVILETFFCDSTPCWHDYITSLQIFPHHIHAVLQWR